MILDSSELVKLYHELHMATSSPPPNKNRIQCVRFCALWRTVSFIMMPHIYETYTLDSWIIFWVFPTSKLHLNILFKQKQTRAESVWNTQSIQKKHTHMQHIQNCDHFCVWFYFFFLNIHINLGSNNSKAHAWHTLCLLFWLVKSTGRTMWIPKKNLYIHTYFFFFIIISVVHPIDDCSYCYFFLVCARLCLCVKLTVHFKFGHFFGSLLTSSPKHAKFQLFHVCFVVVVVVVTVVNSNWEKEF